MIFFTPRSGSSWLTDVLSQTGELSHPAEYFNPNFVKNIASSLGVHEPEEYIRRVAARKASKNGIFGFELTFAQYRLIDADILSLLSPEHFFVLLRRDLIAQAVSLYRAVKSRVFHITEGQRPSVPEVAFDADEILRWAQHIRNQELGLQKLFREKDLEPKVLFYEDDIGDEDSILNQFFNVILNQSFDDRDAIKPKHKKIPPREAKPMDQRVRGDRPQAILELEKGRQEWFRELAKTSENQ